MERIRFIAFINSYLIVKTLKRKLITQILYVVYEEKKKQEKEIQRWHDSTRKADDPSCSVHYEEDLD